MRRPCSPSDALLAHGEVIDPRYETFAGSRLEIGKAKREGLEDSGNLRPFKLARALVNRHLGNLLAIDEKLIALRGVIHVPLRQGPLIREVIAGFRADAKLLSSLPRLHIVKVGKCAIGMEECVQKSHIDL